MRIGHGYDVHRLVSNRKLILGGVSIECEKGLLGHSDADVLLHAICDALLGAAACGDIGGMFPDNDPLYKDADSAGLLAKVVERIATLELRILNIDSTIIAQAPKLNHYIQQMRENIADICRIDSSFVNVKATTEEGLGFSGKGEGIAAHAVVLLDELAINRPS